MNSRTAQFLFAYWNEVRQNRPAPHRFDIEPARLSNILAETLILERRKDSDYYFRLAGTRICEQFGLELRATRFLDFWNPQQQQDIRHLLNAIYSTAEVLIIRFDVHTTVNKRMQFELLLLPLTLDAQTYDRLLGTITCLSPMSDHFHHQITDVRMTHSSLHSPQEIATAASPKPNPQRAHPPSLPSLQGGTLAIRRRRRFRVIDGGLTAQEATNKTT